MSDDVQSWWEHLDAIRRERAWLQQQIKESKTTIEDSRELIRRLDELLAKAEHKP
jgi:hypothetical protein